MQRVGRGGADVPRGVQVVQLVPLADGLGAVGVVAAEALVHVAVEDDALGRALVRVYGLRGIEPHTCRPEFAAANVRKSKTCERFQSNNRT